MLGHGRRPARWLGRPAAGAGRACRTRGQKLLTRVLKEEAGRAEGGGAHVQRQRGPQRLVPARLADELRGQRRREGRRENAHACRGRHQQQRLPPRPPQQFLQPLESGCCLAFVQLSTQTKAVRRGGQGMEVGQRAPPRPAPPLPACPPCPPPLHPLRPRAPARAHCACPCTHLELHHCRVSGGDPERPEGHRHQRGGGRAACPAAAGVQRLSLRQAGGGGPAAAGFS